MMVIAGQSQTDWELVQDCVHCGFCLPSCPTYVLWGEEMDSPRGRIYQMREEIEGEALGPAIVRHYDQCLGCLACVTACPSGVQYGRLIESTRARVESEYRRPSGDRFFRELLFAIFPYHERLRRLLPFLRLYRRSGLERAVKRSGLRQLLPGRLRALEELTPEVPAGIEEIPEWTPARGAERARVGLLLGCVQRAFYSHVNAATVRVLAAEGCGVVAPRSQGCCGALSEHAGRDAEARAFARRLIDTFEATGVEVVVANVAGCGSAMKSYGNLLRDDPAYADRAERFAARVRDAGELLAGLGPRTRRNPLPVTAVYHDACHLAHGQRIRSQPRECLHQIPDLEVRDVPRERDICCGSAGVWNLLEPEPGRELGERKARNVLVAGADLLVTANPGCDLQIARGLRQLGVDLPTAHLMEVLDASIRGLGPEALLAPKRK